MRTIVATTLAAGLGLGLMILGAGAAGSGETAPGQVKPREPVAAALLGDGNTLAVANRRSGTVSLVDLARRRVVAEHSLGEGLSGLALLPDGRNLLVTDVAEDGRGQLVLLRAEGTRLQERARLAIMPYPAGVAVLPDGSRATVAGLWSRRLQVIDLDTGNRQSAPGAGPRVLHSIPLPFPARAQLVLPGGRKVLVADAFGGGLAVVDAVAGRLAATGAIDGHNLRGLALSVDDRHVLLTHQVLDQKRPTTPQNVRGGLVMRNVVRSMPVERLLAASAELDARGECRSLGDGEQGAGDPAGVAVAGDRTVVALAGVDAVTLLPGGPGGSRRVEVGRQPTQVLPAAPGRPLVVLNTLDDTLSLVDVARAAVAATVPLGPRPDLDFAGRGRRLFFDARLSAGAHMSCHSCHTDGHTCGLLADTLGDGSHGTPKRTLTLLGTRLTDPWGWTGQQRYLFEQVLQSLDQTMHNPDPRLNHMGDITSFLDRLPPPPPLEPGPADDKDRSRVERGRRLFEDLGCARCHIPPLTYSTHAVHDVGFEDERGHRTFSPPSLRGVGQGARFLHDGRAATLEEVFTRHRHKVGSGLAAEDLADLLGYLRRL